jgi:hypothetical protein
VVLRGQLGRDRDADLRRGAGKDERLEALPARLHVDRMLVRARHHVRAASDNRFKRAGSAGEIADPDVEPFVLEVAKALGDRQRQVVER